MLTIVLVAIVAIIFAVISLYVVDSAVRKLHNDWSARTDRDAYEEPAERLPLAFWFIQIATVLVLSAGPVALFQLLNWSWAWVIPAFVIFMTVIHVLANVSDKTQRTGIFFTMVPFANALATILGAGEILSCIGWFAGALALVLLANVYRGWAVTNGKKIWPAFVVLALILTTAVGTAFGADIQELFSGKVSVEEADASMKVDLTIDLNHEDLLQAFPDWDGKLWYNQFMSQAEARTQASGFSDAVDYPFSSEGNKQISEVQKVILHSPVYADMVARGIVDIKLSTGETIGSLNPWLVEFISTTDKALVDQNVGWTKYMEWRDAEHSALYLTDAYFDYAARLAIFVGQLNRVGVVNDKVSSLHYCLPLVEDNMFIRTEVVTAEDQQENKPAYVLSYVRKDARGEEFIIGFNWLDKRFEMFESTVEPVEEKTPTPTKPEDKGDDKPTPTPQPTPVDPDPVKPTPTPTPVEPEGKKVPAADPVNQGNAPKGGGENKNPGPGTYQPNDPAPNITIVPENQQNTQQSSHQEQSEKDSGSSYKEPVHIDENKPDPIPFEAPQDSHDTGNQSAGEENGEFYMP